MLEGDAFPSASWKSNARLGTVSDDRGAQRLGRPGIIQRKEEKENDRQTEQKRVLRFVLLLQFVDTCASPPWPQVHHSPSEGRVFILRQVREEQSFWDPPPSRPVSSVPRPRGRQTFSAISTAPGQHNVKWELWLFVFNSWTPDYIVSNQRAEFKAQLQTCEL